MKNSIFLKCALPILLVCLLCTAGVSAVKDTPNLIGTWKAVFAERDSATTDYGNLSNVQATYVIQNQTGPVFEGYMEIQPVLTKNSTVEREGFTGVISDDGTRAFIKEHIEGIEIVDLTGPDTMTVYALLHQDPHGKIDPGITRAEFAREKL